jgi:hypothetical protein
MSRLDRPARAWYHVAQGRAWVEVHSARAEAIAKIDYELPKRLSKAGRVDAARQFAESFAARHDLQPWQCFHDEDAEELAAIKDSI